MSAIIRDNNGAVRLNGLFFWFDPLTNCVAARTARYQTSYDEIARDYDAMTSNPSYAAENDAARELIGPVRGKRILDIGAGTGLLLEMFPGEIDHDDYIGVEPSFPMAERLREKFPSFSNSVIDCSFEDFWMDDFDLVISLFGSPSYIAPSDLARTAEMTRPGGVVVLVMMPDGYRSQVCVRSGIPDENFPESAYSGLPWDTRCPDLGGGPYVLRRWRKPDLA